MPGPPAAQGGLTQSSDSTAHVTSQCVTQRVCPTHAAKSHAFPATHVNKLTLTRPADLPVHAQTVGLDLLAGLSLPPAVPADTNRSPAEFRVECSDWDNPLTTSNTSMVVVTSWLPLCRHTQRGCASNSSPAPPYHPAHIHALVHVSLEHVLTQCSTKRSQRTTTWRCSWH